MSVRFNFFGQANFLEDEEEKILAVTKTNSLLIYLAYRATWVSRSELAYLYRPDIPELEALKYLRKLIFRTKQSPWANKLEVSKSHLRFLVDTDVDLFKTSAKAKKWQDSLVYFKGDFLNGFTLKDVPAFSAWVELERLSLEREWVAVVWKRIEDLEKDAGFFEALQLLKVLQERDTFNEEIVQRQLRLLRASGREKDAADLYESYVKQLYLEFEAEPLEATQALMEHLNKPVFERAAFEFTYSLPAQTTAFVGRELELLKLDTIMRQKDCRLLTIVGLGGSGKTRLAIEFARSQAQHYEDGVFFIALAGVKSLEALIATVAEVLHLNLVAAETPQKQLVSFLKHKNILLILDNFEHLHKEAFFLEELLLDLEKLNLLVTSRQALELRSEWLFDLQGLSFPKQGSEEGITFDAVKLFVNRVERIASWFTRDKASMRAIAEISEFVAGLPLALELAASWTRTLTCQEIITELKQNLVLLEATYQNIPSRQKSIQTVFDYSFDQLSGKEQSRLVSMSLFEGGFDLIAAQELTDTSLDMLLAFMNHSLIRRNAAGRFLMHELLKQYLKEKLSASNLEALQLKNSAYYLNLLIENRENLRGPKPKEVQEKLMQDIDNIRQAYSSSIESEAWALLLKANEALSQLFITSGLFIEGKIFYTQLLGKLKDEHSRGLAYELKIQATLGLARANWHLNDSSMLSYLRKLEVELTNSDNKKTYAQLLFLLSHYLFSHSKSVDEAMQFATECNVIAREANLPSLEQDIQERLAHGAWFKGNYELAVTHLRNWLELSKARQDATAIVSASQILANRLKYIGVSQSEKDAILAETVKYQDEISTYHKAGLLNDYALAFFEKGAYQKSETIFRESYHLSEQCSDKIDSAIICFNLARVLRAQAKFDESILILEKSMELFLLGTLQYAAFAETKRLQEDYVGAKQYLIQALQHYQDNEQPLSHLFDAFACLARIYNYEGKFNEALELATFIYEHKGSGEHQKDAIKTLYEQLLTKQPGKNINQALSIEHITSLQLKNLSSETAN